MLPIIPLGPIALPTYPLMLLFALWAGTGLAAWRATRLQIHSDHVHNATIYALLAGFIGARLWYVLTHWQSYIEQPSQALTLSPIALSAPEGLAFALIAVLIYLQRHRLPLGTFMDALAPGLALALLISHVGRFISGQGLGLVTTLPWAVTVANGARHPIELYQAIACFLILSLLLLVILPYHPWPSFQFWSLVAMYGLVHLILEPLYEQPAVIGSGLLMGQVVGLLMTVVALAVMAYNFTSDE